MFFQTELSLRVRWTRAKLVVSAPYTSALSFFLFPASQFISVALNLSKLPVKPQKCLRKSFASWKRAFYAYFGITLTPRNQAVRHVDKFVLYVEVLQQSRWRHHQDCAILHSNVLYCAILCFTAWYCTIQHYNVLYYAICTGLYCAILCYNVLYFIILCCTSLHCTIPPNELYLIIQ